MTTITKADYVAELDAALYAKPGRGERVEALTQAAAHATSREEAMAYSQEIGRLGAESLAELNEQRAARGLAPYKGQPPQM